MRHTETKDITEAKVDWIHGSIKALW